jgi:hypothetical protein
MTNNRDFDDIEPIDLSIGSRSRKQRAEASTADLKEIARANESREIATSIFTNLTAGSPIRTTLHIPDRIAPILDSYGDLQTSKFYGLVSLILDTAMDIIYPEAFSNVFATLVNDYLDKHELTLAKRWETTYQEGTRAFTHCREVVSSFRTFPHFLYEDVKIYNGTRSPGERYSSALNLSNKLESANLEIMNLNGKITGLKEIYDKTKRTLSERNLRISDLSGLNASMKHDYEEKLNAEIRRYTEYRHYHYGIPRPLRILKRIILNRLSHMKQRHRQ